MKLSKKNKTLLTSTVGLLVATSVVAPLATMTSCSNQGKMLEDLADKEFGVTKETYDDLKNQFRVKYEAKLNDISEEARAERLAELESDLKVFDNVKTQKNCGYTSLTSSLVDFAKNQTDARGEKYGIRLDRKTNATWAQVDGIFNSWKGSFRQYMLNSDMPASAITRVMQDAQNRFIALKKELQQTCNDACDGLIKAKEKIITCFEGVNDEIALISSTMQLKEFMSQYVFEPKSADGNHPDACLDSLIDPNGEYYAPDFVVGSVLSDKTMNQVFKITRKDDGKNINFSSSLVKGFTLFPRLARITSDKSTNNYSFSMDFGITKTSYIGKYSGEKLASVTAHMYVCDGKLGEQLTSSDVDMTLSQLISKMKIATTEYPIYLTSDAELKALEEFYFNKEKDNYISFNFEKDEEKQAYESFFDNAKKDEINGKLWHSSLTSNSLINAGLTISSDRGSSYTSVSELMKGMSGKSIKGLEGEENRERIVTSFEKLFLANCEVHSFAEIDDSKQKVNNTFYVSYKNSIYGRFEEQFEDQRFKLVDTDFYKNPMEGYKISTSFFSRVNQKFNDLMNYIELYDINAFGFSKNSDEKQEEIEGLRNEAIFQMVISSAALAAGLFSVGYMIYSAIAPWKKAADTTHVNKKDTLSIIVCIIFSTILLGLQTASYVLFVKYYFTEIIKFYDEQKEKKEKISEECGSMFETIKQQLKQYFVRINDDFSYDKTEFKTKKANFSALGMEKGLELYRKFNSKNFYEVEGMKEFDAILSDTSKPGWEGVTGQNFKDKIEEWGVGGKWWIISLALSIASGVISIFYAAWVKKRAANFTEEWKKELPELPFSTKDNQACNCEMTYLQNTRASIRYENQPFVSGIEDRMKKYTHTYVGTLSAILVDGHNRGLVDSDVFTDPNFDFGKYFSKKEMEQTVQQIYSQAYDDEMQSLLGDGKKSFEEEGKRTTFEKERYEQLKQNFWERMGFKDGATDDSRTISFSSLMREYLGFDDTLEFDDLWNVGFL